MTSREIVRNQRKNLKLIAIRIKNQSVPTNNSINNSILLLQSWKNLRKEKFANQLEMLVLRKTANRLKNEKRFKVNSKR